MSSKLNIAQLRTLKTILKSYEDYLSSAAISSDKKELILPETNNEFSDIFQGLTSVILNSKQRLHDLSQQNKALKNTANNYAELLNELQTIAHIGTWEWNIEKDIIICSDAVLKIFEIHKRKKIKYQTLLDYTHPEDVRIVDYIFKKAFFDHRSFKIHQRIILNDGKIKFLEVRGAVEANKKDVPLKMYGTIQDISKLKETKDQLFLIKQQLEAKVDERTRDLKRAYRNLENEMELKENAQLKEKELADIVESSEDAIIGKTIDGVIKSWNKGAQKMYGFTEDEMIGTHVNKIIPNSKIKEFEKALTKILTGKKVNSFQTKRQTKTGELLDVSLSISPIKNRIGEVIGFSEITRDITDEINANKRFEVAVEASPNGMIMINEDGKIVMANRQTEKMFGYKHNELIGHSIDKLIPSNLKPTSKSKKTIDSLYQIHGRELFGTQKDGKKIIVEIGLNPIENKEGKFILASVVDITSRKKFEQELKESEEKYRTLIDTMNEGVLILDNHEKILFANDFMCKMLEYEIDELIGKRADKLLLDSEGKKEMQIIIDLHKKGKSSKYEIQLITKSGNKLWMLVSGAPTYNSIGELTGSVSLHTNITSRKLMEEELNSIANIPEENPNPTFRFSIHGQVLMYANPASINTLNFFDDEANRDIRQEWVKQINKVYQIGKPVKKELTVKEQTFMCTIVPVPE
ncbi:MAG: PAS domain S-box protein, partial [Flavobacteriales bacterium]|nr:PAS domain S-box protein [Flavobacteriales bacterium]